MLRYNFKKDTKLYLVSNDIKYNIDISEINFSQDIKDIRNEIKTVQSQNMFAPTIVDMASPANFAITFPALRESDFEVVFDRALDIGTFDLYIVNKKRIFKIDYCVITNATFIIEKMRPLSMSVTGEARKITQVTTIPGTDRTRSSTMTYNTVSYLNVLLNGIAAFERLNSVSIELQNNIKWIPYKTLDEVCLPPGELAYPTNFTVEKRILAGTITDYSIEGIAWDSDATLFIEAGQNVGGTIYGFEFDLQNVTFTSRINTGDIYSQSYDWRLTQNPASLSEIITYITTNVSGDRAILDYWGLAILDSNGLPLLDSF